VEFAWKLYAVRNIAEDRATVVESLILKRKTSFQWLDPSGHTMALRSTQPLTEMHIRDITLGGKGDRYLGLTTLPPSCADCLENLGTSTSWSPKVLSRPG